MTIKRKRKDALKYMIFCAKKFDQAIQGKGGHTKNTSSFSFKAWIESKKEKDMIEYSNASASFWRAKYKRALDGFIDLFDDPIQALEFI